MSEPDLILILHKEAPSKFVLYACRGEGKGCNRNKYRNQKKPCDDCVGPLDEKLTIQQVQDMLARGDG